MNIFIVLFFLVNITTVHTKRGYLVLNGGGDKPASVMQKFINLAGGNNNAKIIVIPTASGDPETPEYYKNLFTRTYNCKNVNVLDIKTRNDAFNERFEKLIKESTGIFFSGGDQTRITSVFLDTPCGRAFEYSYFENGSVMGGTSAGCACMSEKMLTGKGNQTVIERRNIETLRGLGLIKNAILDQHFIERQRQNRLISLTLENPKLLGIGVGEATAIVIYPDDLMEIVGNGWVEIYDASAATVKLGNRYNIGGYGLKMHILQPGQWFNLITRVPFEGRNQTNYEFVRK